MIICSGSIFVSSPTCRRRGGQRRPVFMAFAMGFAAMMIAVAIGAAVLIHELRRAPPLVTRPEAVPSIAVVVEDEDEDKPTPPGIKRIQASLHLRVVASATWDGRIDGNARDLRIYMTAGFAVFAFEGGKGRRMRVETPDIIVEVVGTRFFVEVASDGTHVGVAEGRVRVTTDGEVTTLRVGDSLRLPVAPDAQRMVPVARSYLDDDFLAEHAFQKARRKRARRTRRKNLAELDELFASLGDMDSGRAKSMLKQLQAAEDLAQMGQFRDAIETYREIARAASDFSYRDLALHEMARIMAFDLGEIRQARSTLRHLAKGAQGEVRRQATIALCELDLKARPCEAAACLQELIDGPDADFEVSREAQWLFRHWGLGGMSCDAP